MNDFSLAEVSRLSNLYQCTKKQLDGVVSQYNEPQASYLGKLSH